MDEDTRPIHIVATRDFRSKDTHRLKVKGWEKISCENGNKQKSWGSNTYTRQIYFIIIIFNFHLRTCLLIVEREREGEGKRQLM